MIRLNGIERLSEAEQIKVYSELAARYMSMSAKVQSEGLKLTFNELATIMKDRAARVFAP